MATANSFLLFEQSFLIRSPVWGKLEPPNEHVRNVNIYMSDGVVAMVIASQCLASCIPCGGSRHQQVLVMRRPLTLLPQSALNLAPPELTCTPSLVHNAKNQWLHAGDLCLPGLTAIHISYKSPHSEAQRSSPLISHTNYAHCFTCNTSVWNDPVTFWYLSPVPPLPAPRKAKNNRRVKGINAWHLRVLC